MMENTPVKFRILEFLENGPKRTDEICFALSKEYKGYDSAYGRGMIKFDCIEMASYGLISDDGAIVDEEGILDKGKLLTTYSLTSYGSDYLDYLKKTVKVKKV
ncbi:hypothetical protein PED39_00550 [Methanomassiliicoccales archaeon LGM-RCC1]|nr:hypothetical protein PED39_00550 [Methanomassiliicoccales archaeon LGM-RCC1]